MPPSSPSRSKVSSSTPATSIRSRYSPEGTILYSTEEGRICNELPGEKDHIRDALKDIPVVTTYQGNVSIMLPLRFRSGVGSPAVVQLTRPDTPIATAPGPWNTNALFLFAMLVVLGLAVFGVARLLSVVANAPERTAELPRPAQEPVRATSPQPGLREEGEARRRAEERATAAEERLGLLQDQYRKALEELQDFRELAREPRAAADPKLEERALRAEGQLAPSKHSSTPCRRSAPGSGSSCRTPCAHR